MTQFSTQTDAFLNTNRNIYEVMYLANNANGDIVTTANPLPVSLQSSSGQTNTITLGGTNLDAFARLRVSNPHTLFDSTLRYTDDTRNWSTANTANSSYSVNGDASLLNMVVGTSSGAYVVRQTKRHFLYQPGKSLLTLNSFNMQPKANVIQRVGNFSANNGVYLENDGTNTYIVLRSKSSGTVSNTKVIQSSWSENTLSSLNIDKAQLFWTDFEWLGVGSVRAGFVIDGEFVTCHKFHHANANTGTYMGTATLPIRYEIENVGPTASNTTLQQICSTVMSEGGHTPRVATRSISTTLAGLAMSDVTYRPLIAIRLKSGRDGGVVVPAVANLFGLQTTPFNYKILQDATVSGGAWVSAGDESHVEYNITATAVSGGNNLLQGMFMGGAGVNQTNIDFKKYNSSYQLRTRIDGAMETFVIAAVATTNNDDAVATLTWEEYN